MAKSIKSLLKKGKLTGAEVGRLMIADLVAAYKNAMKGKTDGLGFLNDEEKYHMVNALTGPTNIKQYNAYRDIHNFLANMPAIIQAYAMQAELYFWRLLTTALEANTAERQHENASRSPVIMTQKQYDELKKADFDEKMTWEYSPEDVLIHALEYYFERYVKGEQTPFDAYFEASKEKPIANPRIQANYYSDGGYYVLPDGRTSKDMDSDQWQAELAKIKPYSKLKALKPTGEPKEGFTPDDILNDLRIAREEGEEGFSPLKWVEDNTAPDDATLFDVLEYASGHYYSEETDSKKTIFELADDYPELYTAMIDHLASLPGLSSFKAIKEKDFFKESFKLVDLYANKIMGYPDLVDTFNPDGCGGGVAVLQPHVLYPSYRIDERGYYKAPTPPWERHLIENTLEEKRESIEGWTYQVKQSLAECFAREKAVELIGELIDVPDVDIFIASNDGVVSKIEALNGIYELLHFVLDDRVAMKERREELLTEARRLFTPIDLNALRPTEKSVEAARASLDFSTVQGGSEQFIAALRRDVRG